MSRIWCPIIKIIKFLTNKFAKNTFYKIIYYQIAFVIPIALSSILHFQSSSLISRASTVPVFYITANTYYESGENEIFVMKSEKLNT